MFVVNFGGRVKQVGETEGGGRVVVEEKVGGGGEEKNTLMV